MIATIAEATRAEASAAALRSAAIGELIARQVGDDDDDARASWACDPWDSIAAQIAAAMNISHRKASGQMRIAVTQASTCRRCLTCFGRVCSAVG